MTNEQFNEFLETRLNSFVTNLSVKGNEYTRNNDRFYNFKTHAEILGLTPMQSCLSLMLKNFIGVIDVVQNKEEVTDGYWNEKISDSIQYLILLDGIWSEKNG